jgi:WD40 repeat protein
MHSLKRLSASIVILAVVAGGALAIAPPRPTPRTDLYGDPLPPGALARIGTIRLRHGSEEGGLVRFTADGKALLSICADGVVHFWDVATGRELRRFPTFRITQPHPACCFSADGQLLVSAVWDPEAAIAAWDLRTGRENARCRLQKAGSIWSVALAPDGKTVAVGMQPRQDGRVGVWDFRSGQPLWQQTVDSPVRYVIYTPGGAVVTTTEKGPVFVWDGATGRQLARLPGYQHGNTGGVAASPDGKLLAVGDEKGIALYDAVSVKGVGRLPGEFPGTACVEFSRDSRYLLLRGGPGIVQWELATGRAVRRVSYQNWTNSLDLSPDGKLLACATQGCVRLFDLKSGQQLQQRQAPQAGVQWLAITPDGSAVATAAWMPDGNFALWDPATGRRLRGWEAKSGTIPCLFTPDGTGIFVADLWTAIRLHDWATGRELRSFTFGVPGAPDGPQLAAFGLSPDGKSLTAILRIRDQIGQATQNLRVTWDVTTGKEQSRQPFPADLPAHLPYLALASGAQRLAALDQRSHSSIRLYDLQTGEEFVSLHSDGSVSGHVVFSPDGALLATVCYYPDPGRPHPWKSRVSVWEVATGAIVYELKPVHAWINVAFSADGRLLATGPWANAPIQLWDLATAKEVGRWDGHRAAVSTLAFAPDGSRLATGQTDSSVLVWDIAPALQRIRKPTQAPGPDTLNRLWVDLAGTDARKAQAAIWALVDAPGQTLDLFGRLLRAESVPKKQDIPRLIALLDSGRYTDREVATRQLEALGPNAAPELRKALDERPSPELRRRIGTLLAMPYVVRPPRTPDERRRVRAVRVLERIGSSEACRLLNELTWGPAGAEETWQARAALARLGAQPRARLAR